LIFIFNSLLCYAQRSDTVLLSDVVIYGLPDEKFLAGSTFHSLDTTLRKNQASQHLGETLSNDFAIYFRNYGNGMVSGINLRGTSPQHTAVLWNGININSFSLGQADFSILPVSSTDNVSVHSGGGSARFGSGAIGGTVLLNSNIQNDAPLRATLEIGSFGKYFGSLQSAWNIKQWTFRSRLYHQQSENDFPVGSHGERQENAAILQDGFLQDIQYQVDNANQFAVHYWYHRSDREVQANAGGANSNAEQQDINHRLSFQYMSNGKSGNLKATTGFVHDNIVFEKQPGIVERWDADIKYQKTLPFKIVGEFGASINHIVGKLPQYDGNIIEDRYDLMVSFLRDFGKKLSISVNLRQPFVTGFTAPFLPYLGGTYKVLDRRQMQLTFLANVSRNYRIPTLNDRYWPDVGNVKLLPETSNAAEAGLRWHFKSLTIEHTVFTQVVDQLIKWRLRKKENDVAKYYPENVMQVEIKGMESRISWHIESQDWKLKLGGNYQIVSSVTTKAPPTDAHTLGEQLMYTPKYIASANAYVCFRKYSLSVWGQYNSQRSTDTSNAEIYALDPFAVFNLSIGRSLQRGRNQFDLQASIRNMFDTEYTLYERRALPGRHYNFQINYKLNRKQNEF
jgi:iron complex outermembrane receptor protein